MAFSANHWGGLSNWYHKSRHNNGRDEDNHSDNVEINTAPDAMDDAAMVVAGDPAITIAVLDNDVDAEDDTLTISMVSIVLDSDGNDVGAAATIVGDQISFDPTGLLPGDYTSPIRSKMAVPRVSKPFARSISKNLWRVT